MDEIKFHNIPLSNHQNQPRHVGFELEYVNFSLNDSVQLLQTLFSGNIIKEHDLSYVLAGTAVGNFQVKLDTETLKYLAKISFERTDQNKFDFHGFAKNVLFRTLCRLIPAEITTPPLLFSQIDMANKIVRALQKTTAEDTHQGILNAFGLHINVELPSKDASDILRYMKAYCLLSDWLQQISNVTRRRKLSLYIQDYDDDYIKLILSADYAPTLNELIIDYIVYNPSRNYGLDMLPIFNYLNEPLVRSLLPSEYIATRPAFHYRLPNSNFSVPQWSVSAEWDRWLFIEKVANQPALLEKMAKHYLQLSSQFFYKAQWIELTQDYLING